MESKRFYWIKLKTDFFNQDTIDFLLSQKNGCEYIVLYQMLCLETANNGGKLSTNIGEMIIPYNVDKIVRDTKYFDTDTVVVALDLFKKLGLIYEEENNILSITNFENMVGSECSSAKRVREYRQKQKVLQCNNNVTQEIEKEKEKDKDIDKEIDKEITTTTNIYTYIENNFGITISGTNYEKIESWLSLYDEKMLCYAVDTCVANGTRTIRYLEGILRNWKGNGYKSLADVIENEEKRTHKKEETIEEMVERIYGKQ